MTEVQTKYDHCYQDPRTTPGFPPECYPVERDIQAAVPESIQLAKGRFKAVYARRNLCLRNLSGLQVTDPERPRWLRQVLFLTEAIDYLEDLYAPVGLMAEPEMDDAMFTRELSFTHAPHARTNPEPVESSFSLYIRVPFEDTGGEEESNAP